MVGLVGNRSIAWRIDGLDTWSPGIPMRAGTLIISDQNPFDMEIRLRRKGVNGVWALITDGNGNEVIITRPGVYPIIEVAGSTMVQFGCLDVYNSGEADGVLEAGKL